MHFNAREVKYLDFIVKPNEISIDPTKLTGIKDWIPLKTVKGIRSFLGFGNFYQRFIGNYAEITKPLNELTKKMKIFEWSQECQMAFKNLKKKFLEEPVLIIPDLSKQFFIESDASKWATGAVLRQLNNNRDLYDIYDREMLGIIRALQMWRHFLEGSKHKVIVLSDHKNLTYFQKAQKLNC